MRHATIVPPTRAAISSKFARYGPEKEHIIRKPEVQQNKAVEELKELYLKIKWPCNKSPDYYRMADSLKNHGYSAGDVEKFSVALAEFQDEAEFSQKAGLFLSALINNGKDKDYVIHTRHLSVLLDRQGYQNTKNIIVDGNGGGGVGFQMKSGTITVKGNAGDYVGESMKAGAIIVEGDAGDAVGYKMKGGIITVKGNVSERMGGYMEGGTITVEGNAGGFAGRRMKGGVIHIGGDVHYPYTGPEILGGKIYHKGKLVLDGYWTSEAYD